MENRWKGLEIEEKTATCDNCLCSQRTNPNLPYYDPSLKCCTFHPFFANFTAGALLTELPENHFVRLELDRKILKREYALPLGIFPSVRFQVGFNQRQAEDFGQKKDFLCPYFDRTHRRCGVWSHRGPICTSYYCASDRGEEGLAFWEMWGEYLHRCEMILAQDAFVAMGLSHEGIEFQVEYLNCEQGTPEELGSDQMAEALFKDMWAPWSGTPTEFYRSCYKYIGAMEFREMKSLFLEELGEMEEHLFGQLYELQWITG